MYSACLLLISACTWVQTIWKIAQVVRAPFQVIRDGAASMQRPALLPFALADVCKKRRARRVQVELLLNLAQVPPRWATLGEERADLRCQCIEAVGLRSSIRRRQSHGDARKVGRRLCKPRRYLRRRTLASRGPKLADDRWGRRCCSARTAMAASRDQHHHHDQ